MTCPHNHMRSERTVLDTRWSKNVEPLFAYCTVARSCVAIDLSSDRSFPDKRGSPKLSAIRVTVFPMLAQESQCLHRKTIFFAVLLLSHEPPRFPVVLRPESDLPIRTIARSDADSFRPSDYSFPRAKHSRRSIAARPAALQSTRLHRTLTQSGATGVLRLPAPTRRGGSPRMLGPVRPVDLRLVVSVLGPPTRGV